MGNSLEKLIIYVKESERVKLYIFVDGAKMMYIFDSEEFFTYEGAVEVMGDEFQILIDKIEDVGMVDDEIISVDKSSDIEEGFYIKNKGGMYVFEKV